MDRSTNGLNHGPVWKTQSFLLKAICTVIHQQDCNGKGNSSQVCWNTVGKRFQIVNACSLRERNDYSCLCMWTIYKLAGKKQNTVPMWKVLWKTLIWENQHLSLTTSIWVALNRSAKSEDIVDKYKNMFEIRISAGATEKYLVWRDLMQTSLQGPMMWKVMQTLRSGNCELANKTTQNMESVGELSKVCSHIVLKCPYMAHIGRPDILWSVNKLARSITKWTRACNKRLSRLISFILHTCEYKQYCHVGNTAKQCRLRLFQDSDFAGNLEDSKSTSGGILCIFGSQTFVPTSWMCKTQTSVSHSSTESEIVSLDAGLLMDGISALDLWDLVIEALHSSSNRAKRPKEKCGKACSVTNHRASKHINTQIKTQIQHNDLELTNDDYVYSNVKSSHCGAMLYIFEHNEAVIKMIIKGRSPTMRHVSRTHRVALDWLVDGINLDPKILIKYVDTKNRVADILTKCNFTRDDRPRDEFGLRRWMQRLIVAKIIWMM